jgi:hypothetical protein
MGSGWTRRSPRADDAGDEGPKKHTLGSIAAERAAGGAAAPNALAQLRPQRAAAAIHDASTGGRDLQPAGAGTVAGDRRGGLVVRRARRPATTAVEREDAGGEG